MCVVTLQGSGPLAPAAGKSGAAGVRGKKAGMWQQRCVSVCVGGGANLIPLQVWVLVRLLFTSPLNHTS